MANNNNKSATKVVIPCRISFANIWEPKSINGSDEKYSVSCIIPKSDKATLAKIHKAIEAAKEDGKSRKWGGKIPGNLKLPLRDGDVERADDEAYAEAMYVNANSKDAPQIVDRKVQPILDAMECGSGDYCNVSVNFYAFNAKLLQMANGAVYDENKEVRVIHQHKLEALEDLIEAANGQPVLIAYWFKHDRTRIIEHLESIGYKFGKTLRDIKDSEDIKLWNAGQLPVALIHPASAGHGLNIQSGGHILIWYGLTWSLELYQQTNARLWRQGQTQTVTIHHIVTKNTVDEDVLSALASKDVTQEKLIAAVKARL